MVWPGMNHVLGTSCSASRSTRRWAPTSPNSPRAIRFGRPRPAGPDPHGDGIEVERQAHRHVAARHRGSITQPAGGADQRLRAATSRKVRPSSPSKSRRLQQPGRHPLDEAPLPHRLGIDVAPRRQLLGPLSRTRRDVSPARSGSLYSRIGTPRSCAGSDRSPPGSTNLNRRRRRHRACSSRGRRRGPAPRWSGSKPPARSSQYATARSITSRPHGRPSCSHVATIVAASRRRLLGTGRQLDAGVDRSPERAERRRDRLQQLRQRQAELVRGWGRAARAASPAPSRS